jgi:methionyl-tRNA formyltransferase
LQNENCKLQIANCDAVLLHFSIFNFQFSICNLFYCGWGPADVRLIMLGTGPFAVPTLEALAASRHEVALVVTRPPTGRAATAGPLQRTAESLKLPVWSPATVNAPDAQARLKQLSPDLLVVCDYGEILRPETLATARLGGINLHGSLLPKFRGAAPVQWAILRGERETGNSVIQMTPGLDAGPCLAQQRTPIEPDEDAEQLEARLAAMGAAAVLQVVDALEAGVAQPVAQDAAQASKAPRLKKEQGAIDWSRPAQEIKNQVRGLRPWPRAYTFLHRANSEPLRLNIDRVCLSPVEQGRSVPGELLESAERIVVATGTTPLEIAVLQPAGKRAMSAADFLRGYRPQVGERFGPEV